MTEEKKEKYMKNQIKKSLITLSTLKVKVILHSKIKNMIKQAIFTKK
jgi:hypothetical protein